MVHNGIEYVEMQLLAEVCDILESLAMNFDEIANILESWKKTANSYLLQITIDLLRKKEGDQWLVKKILDKAGNKGTGNWTTIASTQLGVPSTLIASALFSRYTSFYKEERIQLNKSFEKANSVALDLTITNVLEAYQFARIINHYQGFKLISEASNSYSWNLNLSQIARIWTSGCIIKSALMQDLVGVLIDTKNVLTNAVLSKLIIQFKPSIKKVVSQCVLNDISAPCFGESIQFFNAISTANSSANIIQAQRDYFGAHTYKRIDDNGIQSHHTNWK
jgi:6-phosphogluconate dehydrogenase